MTRCLFLVFLAGWSVLVSARTETSYRRIRRESVHLYYQESDRSFAEQAAEILLGGLPGMQSVLGVSKVPDIHVVVAESDAIFHRLTAGTVPDWGVGAADPGSGFIFLKSPRITAPHPDAHVIIRHELAHVLLGNATGGVPVSRWFDEGLAQFLSGERLFRPSIRLARTFAAGRPLYLDEIDDVLTFQKERAALAYETAHSAVSFLIQKHGEASIQLLVGELAAGRTMDEALRTVTGQDARQFEGGWSEEMRRRYRWTILLDFPVFFSVALVLLLAAAFWRTQARVRAKRRLWESETRDEIPDFEKDATLY